MWKAVITTALLTTAAHAADVERCDSQRIQKFAGELYVKSLRGFDPRNTLDLGGLQAVLTDVRVVDSTNDSSSCTAVISFSIMGNKLVDSTGSHNGADALRAREEIMLKSGLYEFVHVQVYDFIRKRSTFSYHARRGGKEDSVDVTDDLILSALR